ncbi:MAG: Fic family protein [Campylobacterota bacterium]|nr:Fic family protein [Campylobacterota bacterium]
MAKNIIEKPPFIFMDEVLSQELFDVEYIFLYKEVDNKGNYLYWDQFKWRVDKDDDVKKAWFATKWARSSKLKSISLFDKIDKPFYFCMPDTLQAKLFKISNLAGQGIIPHNSIKNQYLISSLVMEEAISSSQLEGASTTRKVAKEILVSKKEPKTQDEQMIVNNYFLMKEIQRIKDEELSVDMILNLHQIATNQTHDNDNVAGKLRISNDIVIMDMDDNILHQPPLFSELPQRLQKLCDFANGKHTGEDGSIFIHPIVKAIILHFMIGYEHPFPDGNGRTARALFYWFMLKNGFDYFEYISISKFLKDAPKKYSMSYLYSEVDDNDLTYFVYYQVDIILRAIDDLLEYLKKKSLEYEEVTNILKDTYLNEKLNFVQKDIIKKAIKNPGRVFTGLEISVDYDIAPTTARKYLNELVKYKILANYKDGRTIAYIAPANLHELLKAK